MDWGNCKTLVRHLERKIGGYRASRPTKHKHWWPIFRRHELWLPPECPDKGKPCPYLVSAVPARPFKGIFKKFPWPWFRLRFKSGDS